MMRKSFRLLTILLIAVFSFTAFSQSFALRHPSGAVNAHSKQVQSSIRQSTDITKHFTPSISARIMQDEIYMLEKSVFDNAVYELKTPLYKQVNDYPEDISDTPVCYTSTQLLDAHAKSSFYTTSNATLSRVSLGISSPSAKTISVCASVSSNGLMDKIGISSLKIQRYFKGRWLTVSSVTNLYNNNSTYYMYYVVRSSCTSGNYYRVTATFVGIHNDMCDIVSKTTQAVRCR